MFAFCVSILNLKPRSRVDLFIFLAAFAKAVGPFGSVF